MIAQNTLIITSVEVRPTKNGERAFIGYLDPNTLNKGQRIADKVFAKFIAAGESVSGTIVKADVQPYTYTQGTGADAKVITAHRASVVKLATESLNAAIVAAGREVPVVAITVAVPEIFVQPTA